MGQVARWIDQLAEYDFEIVHRPGKQHANADAVSRYPHKISSVSIDEQWLSPSLKKDFPKQQEKDLTISVLIDWVKKIDRPSAEQLEGASRVIRYYWARYDELTLQDDILGIWHAFDEGPDRRFCAIIPKASRKEILEMAHNSAAGGHFGIQKTRKTSSTLSLDKDESWCS